MRGRVSVASCRCCAPHRRDGIVPTRRAGRESGGWSPDETARRATTDLPPTGVKGIGGGKSPCVRIDGSAFGPGARSAARSWRRRQPFEVAVRRGPRRGGWPRRKIGGDRPAAVRGKRPAPRTVATSIPDPTGVGPGQLTCGTGDGTVAGFWQRSAYEVGGLVGDIVSHYTAQAFRWARGTCQPLGYLGGTDELGGDYSYASTITAAATSAAGVMARRRRSAPAVSAPGAGQGGGERRAGRRPPRANSPRLLAATAWRSATPRCGRAPSATEPPEPPAGRHPARLARTDTAPSTTRTPRPRGRPPCGCRPAGARPTPHPADQS